MEVVDCYVSEENIRLGPAVEAGNLGSAMIREYFDHHAISVDRAAASL